MAYALSHTSTPALTVIVVIRLLVQLLAFGVVRPYPICWTQKQSL